MVNDITVIDETIEVSKYVLRYNCRLLHTKQDLDLMKSVEDRVLSWSVDVNDELDLITVYYNYVVALGRMNDMLRDE